MAISRYKTFVDGQALSAADLNGIQDAVVNNDQNVGNPRTAPFDLDGQRLIISGDGNTSLISSSAGKIDFRLNSADLFDLDGTTAASVNGFSVITAATAGSPRLQAKGSDTNIAAVLASKGTGAAILRSNGMDVVTADGSTASSVNAITVTSSATGNSPQVKATGSDTDINLRLTPKGAGVVNVASGQGYAVDGTTARTWKMAGSGTSLLFQENTGTPSVPVWTTRIEFQTGTSGTFSTSGTLSFPRPFNYLGNGAMLVQQRYTAAKDTNAFNFAVDRWSGFSNNGGGAGFGSNSRQALGVSGFAFANRVQRVAGQTGTSAIQLGQAIPSDLAATLAGQTVTLSFYARAGANYSAASSILSTTITTGTGTDEGTPLLIGVPFVGTWAGAATQSKNHTISTTLTRFTHTVTLAANATEVGVVFSMTPVGTAGAADYFEVTGVLLQLGSVAGDYPHLSFAQELLAAQRFFCKTFPYATVPADGAGYTGSLVRPTSSGTLEPAVGWRFPAEMILSPTVTLYNPGGAGTAGQWRDSGNTASSAGARSTNTGTSGTQIDNNGGLLTAAARWHIHAAADTVIF